MSLRIAVLLATVAATGCTKIHASPAKQFVAISDPTIALTNLRVIDGTGQPLRRAQTIVIDNGRITEVGDGATVKAPAGARIVDFHGRTALPGLVMMHEHLFYTPDGNGLTSTPSSFAPLYLAGGATTIRTAGSMVWRTDVALRSAIEAGEIAGPDIDLTSAYLDAPLLPFLRLNSGEARGRSMAASWASRGATSLKAYEGLTRLELKGLIDEGHERGLKITGHLCATTFSEAADLDIDNIEHGIWTATDFVEDKVPDVCPDTKTALSAVLQANRSAIQRVIDKLVARGVAVTSTLAVFETFVTTREPAVPQALEVMAPTMRTRSEQHRAELAASPHPAWSDLLRKEMEFERAFVRAGGLLVAGSDPTGHGGVIAGFSNHRQIQLLVEAGFSPVEAIQIATLIGARYLGRDDQIGSIERGKSADLVIVGGDPDDNIAAISAVEMVFKKGVGYDAVKLRESVRGMVGAK